MCWLHQIILCIAFVLFSAQNSHHFMYFKLGIGALIPEMGVIQYRSSTEEVDLSEQTLETPAVTQQSSSLIIAQNSSQIFLFSFHRT